jgi:hypothetical protein
LYPYYIHLYINKNSLMSSKEYVYGLKKQGANTTDKL